ncbi:MAG TPA: hypothetical protein VH120_02595, partial [Gemmataceae bacterium]|nr:hypothetical protein [Gemmataceae bacterium]
MSRSWNSWLARWKAAISPTRRSQRRKSGRIRLGLDSLETRVTPAVTYGQLLGQHAIVVADRIAPTIKLDFVLDPSGKNQTITGRVSDNFPISGTTLYMRQDNGTPRTLALGASGQFQFTTTYAVNGTADGAKTFTFVAIDKAGNVSAFARTSFTLNTTNGGALTLKLDP